MKRIILFVMLWLPLQAGAQKFKRFSIDVLLEQNFQLTRWQNDSYLNDAMMPLGSFDLKNIFSWRIDKQFGLYADISLMLANGFYDQPIPIETFGQQYATGYFTKDESYYSGRRPAKYSVGVSYMLNLPSDRWSVKTSLGIGAMKIPYLYTNVVFKKIGANDKIRIQYIWPDTDKLRETGRWKSFLAAQVAGAYRISPRTKLECGLTYRYYLFNTDITKLTYDGNDRSLISREVIKGNRVMTLGVNVGFSFMFRKK